jgi:beta-galactosidase
VSDFTADGEDQVPVAVSVVDAKGRVVPTADNMVTFRIAGPAVVCGVGNGDPSCHEPDKASKRSAFNGYCMAVLQAGEKAGSVTLTATSPGLTSATVVLKTGE